MKKIVSILMTVVALGLSTATFAQKAAKGNLTTEVQLNFQTGTDAINVVAPYLNFRYFLADQMALRLKLGVSSNKETTGDFTHKTSSFTIAPGFEKHFTGTDKLSPYVGLEISFSSGKDEQSTGAVNDPANYKYSSIGAGIVFGGDYYVWQNIYVGAEVGFGFHSSTDKPEADGAEKTKNSGLGYGTNEGIRLGMKF